MKTHTTLGYQILSGADSKLLNLASEIALYHHEKWDGSGYPENLQGDKIPISCRIVAAADVFDALLSHRPYKQPWTLEQAMGYMNSQNGLHFDPQIIEIFNHHQDQIVEIRSRYQDPLPGDSIQIQDYKG